jgi:ABC-2 type transport system permease protein
MASLAISAPAARRTAAPTLPIYFREARYEFLKLFRARTYSLSTVGFPVMFYLLFGVTNRGASDGVVSIAKYLLGGYCCFGLVGAALFSIGVGLAGERAAGWLELKRSSPMPPLALLVAKVFTAMAFGAIIVAILSLIAIYLGGVHLSPLEFVELVGTGLAGTIPFAAMGLLIALTVPANAATGVVNLVYLPMSFMSGLWIPLHLLPKWLQAIAPSLPTYHLSQLMLSVFGYQNASSRLSHWLGLAGFTLLMLGASWAVFQRAEQDA